jgi:hypothetical protein
MNLTISEFVASSLREASSALGVSPQQLAEQLLQDHLVAELDASGTAFLAERAMMQQYNAREAAEAAVERLNERAISESLEGSPRLLVAEVAGDDGAYHICAHWLNQDGWIPAISGLQ